MDVQNVEQVNLAGNSIGKLGCEYLAKLIMRSDCKLAELNLEGNKLGDLSAEVIIEAVEYNKSIKKLNLSKNFLTDKSASKLASMLEGNPSITELYCKWNQFKSPGGLAILKAIGESSSLRVLDLSWNSLGLYTSPFAKGFGEFIKKNQTLMHLDLSNNYFSRDDAKAIAEGLKENHTLYGFHFHGNIGYVDPKGFLLVPEDFFQSESSQHTIHDIDGIKIQSENIKRYHNYTHDFKDVCWICEGWSEMTLGWNPGKSGIAENDPIFLHLSYEYNKGRFISKANQFKSTRMVPPVQFNYFFSIDGFQFAAEDQYQDEPRDPHIAVKYLSLFNNRLKSKERRKKFMFLWLIL